MSSEEIQFNLVVSTELTYSELRKLEIVLMRVLSYAQRLTGDPNLSKVIEVAQKALVTVRSLQIAIRSLQLASGPIGWAYFATTAVAAGLSGYSIYESMRGV